MSSLGLLLIRGRSHQVVTEVLGAKAWFKDVDYDRDAEKPMLMLSCHGMSYYPATAEDLEQDRQHLLGMISADELRRVHDDPRGMFVFDPMYTEESGAQTYDEITAACLPDGGRWFDPFRPIAEQKLRFEELETIEIDAHTLDEMLGERPKKKSTAKKARPAKKAAAKPARQKPAAKTAAPKKPAAKQAAPKKAAAKQPAAKQPAAKQPVGRAAAKSKQPAAKKRR